jgi:hypothetical protein
MDDTSERISDLRRLLARVVATKRSVTSNSKRLGTVSDTLALRKQIVSMLSRLKQELEEGSEVAARASTAVMDASHASDIVRARHITNVQQMERQLMAIANDYPALVRGIAAKQHQSAPRSPTRRGVAHHGSVPLLGVAGTSEEESTAEGGQQQQQLGQQQERSEQDVSHLEVQQLSQDIRERDRDIQELVGTALDIRQVAADIACLIDHQATAVNQVADNMESVSHYVDMGTEQVARAHARQKKFTIGCIEWVLIALGIVVGLYIGFLL